MRKGYMSLKQHRSRPPQS